jgi:eukaryotic-like serine/threonine-protein kinase
MPTSVPTSIIAASAVTLSFAPPEVTFGRDDLRWRSSAVSRHEALVCSYGATAKKVKLRVSANNNFPAEMLEGLTLGDGWKVVERYKRDSKFSGGNFCVGYRVEHSDGRQGFCKALDYAAIFTMEGDPATLLQELTQSYNFERDVLRKCDEFRMSRIIRILGDGVTTVDGFPIPVSYIIFEYAQYDVRHELDEEKDLEAALRLRTLHHVATGLKQLHGIDIAHQDLKPSNVLIVDPCAEKRSSKLGDLGRATDRRMYAPHDEYPIAGDPAYAPPEQLYSAVPIEFGPRRLACDLYHLGSLIAFMFTSVPMNGLLLLELHPSHQWNSWTGTYAEVMPYVRDAYGRALVTVHAACPPSVADRLTKLVEYLCEPNPSLRGHPAEKRNSSNQYGLQRVVSELDLLATRAAMRVQGKQV